MAAVETWMATTCDSLGLTANLGTSRKIRILTFTWTMAGLGAEMKAALEPPATILSAVDLS